MEYERKKRNVTYTSNACKMYLRHDFKHKCAYCGSIEEVLSHIPEVADKLFEKDHFMPQSQKCPETNNYPNLFYACSTCNRKKSDILVSLNPCQDDIFSGDKPHITGGTVEKDYIVEGTSSEGRKFISELELNSQYHRRLRKQQHRWLLAKQKSVELLQDLRNKEILSEEDLSQIQRAINVCGIDEKFKIICGGSDHALKVIEACQFLDDNGYSPCVVLNENEVDITAVIHGKKHCGTIRIESSIKELRLKTRILKEQKDSVFPFGIFVYIPDQQSMYYYLIDFNDVDWSRKEYRISKYVQL